MAEKKRSKLGRLAWIGIVAVLGWGCPSVAEQLVVSFMVSSGNQRTLWDQQVVKKFKDANPDVQLTQIVRGQEDYKAGFVHMLQTDPVDVAFWFAGEKLLQVVRQGLLRPLDTPALKNALSGNFVASTVLAGSVHSEIFALPLSYYGWGFYYRKSLFASLNLRPPSNWSEFLQVGQSLKAAGIAPTAVGASEGWPAAAWFDYLNLRINGIEFHRKLLAGQARFSDTIDAAQ